MSLTTPGAPLTSAETAAGLEEATHFVCPAPPAGSP
jgi:hypothetical protein